MLHNLTGWHLVIILVIVVLLFGATRLPTLAKSVGQSMKIFRQEMKTQNDEPETGDSSKPTSTNL
jgi:sec-independent protein translocase protein TatA